MASFMWVGWIKKLGAILRQVRFLPTSNASSEPDEIET